LLRSLGFSEGEIFRAQLDDKLSPFVKSIWYGEEGYFGIGTGVRLDVSLNGVGIRSGKLPLVRERGDFDVYRAVAVSLLGKERPEGEVTVFSSGDEGNVFGTVGALYFRDRVLAVDPAAPSVGVMDRNFEPVGEGWTRLSLVGESGLPVTADVRVRGMPERQFLTLLSTSEPSSIVASTLMPDQAEEEHELDLGDARLKVTLRAGALPEYVVPLGGDLQVVLGADALCRFLTVFDFRVKTVWMRAYPGAI
jgi:hypothetical protein